MRTVSDAHGRVDRLIELMRPVAVGDGEFLGQPGGLNLHRAFGGEVLGQALLAAAATTGPDRAAHSLHAYFLRPGDPRADVTYHVERVRDGRRLDCRSVRAEQGGTVIATMTASFADRGGLPGGVGHQRRPPVAPPVDALPTLREASAEWGGLGPAWDGFDLMEMRLDPRRVDSPGDGDLAAWTDHVWQRVPRSLPDDPALHQALLVYASDVLQLASALVPHGVALGHEVATSQYGGVSVDHAVWFHRPVRADEWLLFEQCSPVADQGRAFTRAEVFTPAGELVATVAQEGLIFGVTDGVAHDVG